MRGVAHNQDFSVFLLFTGTKILGRSKTPKGKWEIIHKLTSSRDKSDFKFLILGGGGGGRVRLRDSGVSSG